MIVSVQRRHMSDSVSRPVLPAGVLSPGSHESYVDEGAESPYDHYSDSDSDAGGLVTRYLTGLYLFIWGKRSGLRRDRFPYSMTAYKDAARFRFPS